MSTGVALLWSGGKDAALAYHTLHQDMHFQVKALITTLSADGQWVPMHGIHRDVVAAQAEALCIPWIPVPLPDEPSNTEYEAALQRAFATHLPSSVTALAAGDIFLDDVRAYRARLFESCGYEALFPLWSANVTRWPGRWAEARGTALISSVDPGQLAPTYIGRRYDAATVNSLPPAVDAAGETGAFHTVVTNLNEFAAPVRVRLDPHDATGFTVCAPVRLARFSVIRQT